MTKSKLVRNAQYILQKTSSITGHVCEVPSLIAKSTLDDVHDNFVMPFIQSGPYFLPDHDRFAELERELASTYTDNNPVAKVCINILTILKQSKDLIFEGKLQEIEIEFHKSKIERLELKIKEVLEKSAPAIRTLEGEIATKQKSFKSFAHSHAKIDLIGAWHLFLYPADGYDFSSEHLEEIRNFIDKNGKEAAYNRLISYIDAKLNKISF